MAGTSPAMTPVLNRPAPEAITNSGFPIRTVGTLRGSWSVTSDANVLLRLTRKSTM